MDESSSSSEEEDESISNASIEKEPSDLVQRATGNNARNENRAPDAGDNGVGRGQPESSPGPSRYVLLQELGEEIDLATSLVEQEANDLAIHLYNAHALKRRFYPVNPNTLDNLEPTQRKTTWTTLENPREWVPRRDWTTWPLPPDELPLEDDRYRAGQPTDGLDAWTIKHADEKDWKPSRDLEELLLEQFLKQKRLKLGNDPITVNQSTRRAGSSIPLATVPDEAALLIDDGVDSSSDSEMSGIGFMMDEDKAKRILQPAIRRILSQLDDLLLGLHKARPSQTGSLPNKKRKLSDNSEDSFTGATTDLSTEETEGFGSGTVGNRKKRGYKQVRCTDRDWSEVLGTAALIGWDADVVKTAARRCSELFGESMTFQTMVEESVQDQ